MKTQDNMQLQLLAVGRLKRIMVLNLDLVDVIMSILLKSQNLKATPQLKE